MSSGSPMCPSGCTAPAAACTLRTTAEFLRERSGDAKPSDLLRYVRAAPQVPPVAGDELGGLTVSQTGVER